MKKNILVWFFAFGIILSLSAHPVDKKTALKVAKNFYSERMTYSRFPGVSSIRLVQFRNVNSYYVVNLKYNKGFVLVAADDISKPVWAYSFKGKYSEFDQPENVASTIKDFNLQLEYLRSNKIEATDYIKSQWSKYKKAVKTKAPPQTLGPLLTTIWAQGCYYNNSTPIDSAGPCYHVVTGCVATAMAQVINYYNYPVVGSGSHSYNSNYGTLTANFGASNYNWNLMADTLSGLSSSAQVNAVANLISDCGIAVDMNYSPGGSGAYSQNAANAFTHYFNFDNGLQLLRRANYPDSIWEQMVRQELDSLHPLYYDGSGTGGHAFVCDGYQSNDYFHFNWGWSGSFDGYYLLTSLNPGGTNFSNYCGAVFGMKPGIPTLCSGLTDTLIANSGNISDGSYSTNYQDNVNCSWLIKPNNAISISLEFYTFDLLPGDSLFVYDGPNNTSSLIAAYSGNSLPASIASSSGQMFVQFVSDNQNTAAGWSAYYRSEFCNGLKILQDPVGLIEDGSGQENYNDNTNCFWLISDSTSKPIRLDFTKFNTELSYDYVDVYDGASTSAMLLGSFSGNTLPGPLTSYSGNMLIHFHSDGGVTDEGWAANYSICGQPQAPASKDTLWFCTNDSVILMIPNYIDSFAWIKDGIIHSQIQSKQWIVKQPGIYSYLYYSSQCADSISAPVVLIEDSLPNVSLGNDTILCSTQNLTLNISGTYASYLWSTGDTTQSIVVSAASGNSQEITVEVTNTNGCSARDSVHIDFINCTSIEESFIDYFILYPNPARDYIVVQFVEAQDTFDISVVDMQGHIVYAEKGISTINKRIDISTFAKGVYYLVVKNVKYKAQKKFLKK